MDLLKFLLDHLLFFKLPRHKSNILIIFSILYLWWTLLDNLHVSFIPHLPHPVILLNSRDQKAIFHSATMPSLFLVLKHFSWFLIDKALRYNLFCFFNFNFGFYQIEVSFLLILLQSVFEIIKVFILSPVFLLHIIYYFIFLLLKLYFSPVS